MTVIHSFPLGSVPDASLVYAVTVAHMGNQYLFCRHRDRTTWECPGGHIEPGESPLEAARRELWEETGAHAVQLEPICIYRAECDGIPGPFGLLCRAEVSRPDAIPDGSEIAEARVFDQPPLSWTYPDIIPWLLEHA